jgi:hypothetical protein
MSNLEKTYQFIKIRGPVIPVQIAKELGTDILMASAILSELVSNKRLEISSLKVGSTPVYYLKEQEIRLQSYSKYLNDKEQKAFTLLREKQILKDTEQEPVIRVALRQIKDFAKPMNVTIKGSQELYWKWYLIDNQEASGLIKKQLGIVENKPSIQKEIVKKKEQQQKIVQPKVSKPREKKPEGVFFQKVLSYLQRNNIIIDDKQVIRKNTEMEMVIQMPTPVGKVPYFCVVKNKKRVSDNDISAAFAKGQIRKLPVLLVTPGELTKKAQELIQKEMKSVQIKKL